MERVIPFGRPVYHVIWLSCVPISNRQQAQPADHVKWKVTIRYQFSNIFSFCALDVPEIRILLSFLRCPIHSFIFNFQASFLKFSQQVSSWQFTLHALPRPFYKFVFLKPIFVLMYVQFEILYSPVIKRQMGHRNVFTVDLSLVQTGLIACLFLSATKLMLKTRFSIFFFSFAAEV